MAPASVMQIDLWKGHETELKNLKRDLRKAKSSFGSVADREALLAGATSDDVCASQCLLWATHAHSWTRWIIGLASCTTSRRQRAPLMSSTICTRMLDRELSSASLQQIIWLSSEV